jgi:chemotaxis protein MotB
VSQGYAAAANRDQLASLAELALDWDTGDREETWLVTYADILSIVLTMVVLLFGRMAMTTTPPVAAIEAETADSTEPAAFVVAEDASPTAAVESTVEPTPAAERVVADDPVAADDPIAVDQQANHLAALVEQRFAGRITAEQRKEDVMLTISEVALFESSRAALQETASPLLTELAATLREVGDVQLAVQGHTDSNPLAPGARFESNWDLAAARANAVARYLLAHGFDPARLRSVSYADTRPVADNSTAEGRAANRRVELQVEFVAAP